MYQIPEFLKYKKLFHAFSEVGDGNMANVINGEPVDFSKVRNNRERFLYKIGVPIDKTVCMWVVHGDGIIKADDKLAGKSMKDYRFAVKTDGFMTDKIGLYLFLLVADCLPIIIYDIKKNVVALIHAGWKGVDLEIAGKAVNRMKEYYRSDAKDLIVGIGPCVYKESFIKHNPSQRYNPKWKKYIKKTADNLFSVDLIGYVKDQLITSGVKEKNIFESGIDTAKSDRFFSHIRDTKNHISRQGRFACVVGLK